MLYAHTKKEINKLATPAILNIKMWHRNSSHPSSLNIVQLIYKPLDILICTLADVT